MAHPEGGYFTVWAELDEDDPLKVNLDLICEWRLVDGKLLFLQVTCSSEDEVRGVLGHVKAEADMLAQAIKTCVDTCMKATALIEPKPWEHEG